MIVMIEDDEYKIMGGTAALFAYVRAPRAYVLWTYNNYVNEISANRLRFPSPWWRRARDEVKKSRIIMRLYYHLSLRLQLCLLCVKVYYTKLSPVISLGCGMPISLSTVGARSASLPGFSVGLSLASTRNSGTGFLVCAVLGVPSAFTM